MIDVIILTFLLIAVIAGYFGGGFREILKLICMIFSVLLFSLGSVNEYINSAFDKNMAIAAYILSFLVVYFASYYLIYWVLRPIIKQREGSLGNLNKILGVITGLLKGSVVVVFAAYIVTTLWDKKVLIEIKPALNESFLFRITTSLLSLFS